MTRVLGSAVTWCSLHACKFYGRVCRRTLLRSWPDSQHLAAWMYASAAWLQMDTAVKVCPHRELLQLDRSSCSAAALFALYAGTWQSLRGSLKLW